MEAFCMMEDCATITIEIIHFLGSSVLARWVCRSSLKTIIRNFTIMMHIYYYKVMRLEGGKAIGGGKVQVGEQISRQASE
jgi:hypothetical protein